MLPGSSHSRLGFSPSKEARVGIVRDRQTSSLLEEITTRLHDIFAKKFEQNLTEIEGRVLALEKQCFSRDCVIGFPESLEGSMEKHLEHRSEFLVQLDQSIVLRFLFTRVIFRIQIRQLSREGRELVGAEVSLKYSIFHILGKIGGHRDTTG